MRRFLFFLVIVAVGFAGLPSHADTAGPIGHEQHHALQAVEHDDHLASANDAADVECMEVEHCSPVQLLFDHQDESSDLLRREAWSAPRDVFAGSLKPEASTPPPESA